MCSSMMDSIGNTPMLKLQNSDIHVKLEQFNLGGSIKSRVAFRMIEVAIKSGVLTVGSNQTVLEASGGNTGIGLAILCAFHGFKLKLVIPKNYSQQKISELKLYGVDVILTSNTPRLEAKKIKQQNPDYVYLDQFTNIENVQAHYFGTGEEIINQLGHVDYFFAAIGSGGTITGIGKRLKEFCGTKIIGVLPKGYSIRDRKFISHKIQGIGIGFQPSILDVDIIDQYVDVSNEDLRETSDYLVNHEGLFLGLSSVANVSAILNFDKSILQNKIVVTIAPDSGSSYINDYKELMYA